MIRLIDGPDFVELEASGTLTSGDYDEVLPRIEALAEQRGPLRFYIELKDFRGWSPAALWRDIKFDMRHQADMDRVAIVGENRWEKWLTQLSRPFFRADVRYFAREHADEARRWVREN